ncbi:jg12824 [Pararge aegeria aegeria]|uniref:Jg12824 protein n=1 Tax=Pararge aegeria aegeria TaxID=348720 RepID=A0A8S4RJK6_9NEOP|nr:jg12824 [Pararge aegeria aegeria]
MAVKSGHYTNPTEKVLRDVRGQWKGMNMVGVKQGDKIRSSNIRDKTGVPVILTRMDQLKWRKRGYMLHSRQVEYPSNELVPTRQAKKKGLAA